MSCVSTEPLLFSCCVQTIRRKVCAEGFAAGFLPFGLVIPTYPPILYGTLTTVETVTDATTGWTDANPWIFTQQYPLQCALFPQTTVLSPPPRPSNVFASRQTADDLLASSPTHSQSHLYSTFDGREVGTVKTDLLDVVDAHALLAKCLALANTIDFFAPVPPQTDPNLWGIKLNLCDPAIGSVDPNPLAEARLLYGTRNGLGVPNSVLARVCRFQILVQPTPPFSAATFSHDPISDAVDETNPYDISTPPYNITFPTLLTVAPPAGNGDGGEVRHFLPPGPQP